MRLLSTVVHSPPWLSISDSFMDESLRRNEFLPFRHIQWEKYDYLEDHLHFTPSSESSFLDDLKKGVEGLQFPLLVMSDSTFSHNGSDSSRRFESMFPEGDVTVDAVSGSGFITLGRKGKNFRSRLHNHSLGKFNTLLLIGGWNDYGHAAQRFDSAVKGFVHACKGRTRT